MILWNINAVSLKPSLFSQAINMPRRSVGQRAKDLDPMYTEPGHGLLQDVVIHMDPFVYFQCWLSLVSYSWSLSSSWTSTRALAAPSALLISLMVSTTVDKCISNQHLLLYQSLLFVKEYMYFQTSRPPTAVVLFSLCTECVVLYCAKG